MTSSAVLTGEQWCTFSQEHVFHLNSFPLPPRWSQFLFLVQCLIGCVALSILCMSFKQWDSEMSRNLAMLILKHKTKRFTLSHDLIQEKCSIKRSKSESSQVSTEFSCRANSEKVFLLLLLFFYLPNSTCSLILENIMCVVYVDRREWSYSLTMCASLPREEKPSSEQQPQ